MLITSRRFLPLFITQFLGAFNDNLLKNALVILITYNLVADKGSNPQVLVTIAAGIFILPFFLFSALAGQLADKFDRAKIARVIKIFEIFIMLLASVGFIMENSYFLIAVLFACGTHSAFFGPIKYALLPQHLHTNELLSGNAYIEGGTFLAILLGTICGGIFIIQYYGAYAVSIGLFSIACLGLVASFFIPKAPPPVPQLKINCNFIQETLRLIAYSRMNKQIFLIILCISWFWFIGATFLAQIPTFVKTYLQTEAKVVTLFFTLFSVGISIGAFICSKLLHGNIRNTFVPAATLGMSIFIIDLYYCSYDKIFFNLHALLSMQQFLHMDISWRIMCDLLLIAICGGIYIVPLYTMLQYKGDKKHMARIIAANNIFNALFMVLAMLFTLTMLTIAKTIPDVFLTIAIINLVIAIYIAKVLKKT